MKSEAKKNYDLLVLGGGASGLMAAITAARQGVSVLLIEHKDRVGKKLLSTGNGKCNYTNSLQGISNYRGDNPAFVLPVFEQFGLSETLSFFNEIGIYPKCRNGYYYPASEQAASVLEVLRMEAAYRNVNIRTETTICSIQKTKNGFRIDTKEDTFYVKKIIFATGLLAAPKTGSDGSAFPDIVPALVALKGKQPFFKALAGIRAEIMIKLYVSGEQVASENGELQLTDYGISGIPVFQISRYATKAIKRGKDVYALLDFMPHQSYDETEAMLKYRFFETAHEKTAEECLIGLFNKKLGAVLLKEAGIGLNESARNVTGNQIKKLIKKIKALRVDITGSNSFEQAQVCAGGVSTDEIDNQTMESLLVPGLYFAGELIDIDGICGGYNLQWAWSSGYVAGMHAAGAVRGLV